MTTFCFAGLIGMLLCACTSHIVRDGDALQGTFFRTSVNEFGVIDDTIRIIRTAEKVYSVLRTTTFHYNSGDMLRQERWTGSFDDQQRVLLIRDNGKMISFDALGDALFIGNVDYKKLQ